MRVDSAKPPQQVHYDTRPDAVRAQEWMKGEDTFNCDFVKGLGLWHCRGPPPLLTPPCRTIYFPSLQLDRRFLGVRDAQRRTLRLWIYMMKFKPNQTRTYDGEGFKRRAACLCFRNDTEDEVRTDWTTFLLSRVNKAGCMTQNITQHEVRFNFPCVWTTTRVVDAVRAEVNRTIRPGNQRGPRLWKQDPAGRSHSHFLPGSQST